MFRRFIPGASVLSDFVEFLSCIVPTCPEILKNIIRGLFFFFHKETVCWTVMQLIFFQDSYNVSNGLSLQMIPNQFCYSWMLIWYSVKKVHNNLLIVCLLNPLSIIGSIMFPKWLLLWNNTFNQFLFYPTRVVLLPQGSSSCLPLTAD